MEIIGSFTCDNCQTTGAVYVQQANNDYPSDFVSVEPCLCVQLDQIAGDVASETEKLTGGETNE